MASPLESIISDTSIVSGIGEAQQSTQKYDRWASAGIFALSALTLTIGLDQSTPRFAMLLTAAAFLLCIVGLALAPVKSLERLGDRPVVFVLAVALVVELAALVPSIKEPPSRMALVAAAVIAGSNLASARWMGRGQIPALCAAHVAFNVLRMLETPAVKGPLTTAAASLASGVNPYLAGGYHDLPLPILLSVPSVLFQRDPLASLALASTAAGAFLAYARPGRVGGICAALLMLLPQTAAAIDSAGAEPFAVMLLAATVFCACRYPKAFPWVLGLFLASKAYLVLALPAVLVLSTLKASVKAVVQIAWKALLVAALVTAPFALWDSGAFFRAVFSLDGALDAKSPTFLSWVSAFGGPALPGWIGVVVALALIPLVLGRAARTASGFAAGVGLIYFGLFAFSAHAQPSQYALVLAALFISIGATGLPGKMDEGTDLKSVYFKNA